MSDHHHVIVDWDYGDFVFEDDGRIVSFDTDPVENEILVSGWPMVGAKLDRVRYRRIGDGKYERMQHDWCANRDCPVCLQRWKNENPRN